MTLNRAGQVVIASLSQLDGKVVSFDDQLFGAMLHTAQQGSVVLIVEDDADLLRITSFADEEPILVLLEAGYFSRKYGTVASHHE